MSHTRKRYAAASLAALAVLGMGASTMAPAFAAPVAAPAQAAANPALIDATAPVSLAIHKYLGDPVGGPGNGMPTTVGGRVPLMGVEFDVYQVAAADGTPIDLKSNAGWDAAAAINSHVLTRSEVAARSFTVGTTTYRLLAPTEVVTNNLGVAMFTKAAGAGLYAVNETIESTDEVFNVENMAQPLPVNTSSLTPASPFLVTLPMTNPTNLSQWVYDVNVYPKNQVNAISKSVEDLGTVTGEMGALIDPDVPRNVIYTLTSTITGSMTGPEMGTYVVYDHLDAQVVATGVTVSAGPSLLVAGTDYTVYVDNVATDVTAPGYRSAVGAAVEVVMTPAGLVKLAAAKAASQYAQVETVITAQVEGTEAEGEVVDNSAQLVPNNAWWFSSTNGSTPYNPGTDDPDSGDTPPPTSETVRSLYGDLRIHKSGPDGTPLSGATFSIYTDVDSDGICNSDADLGQLLMSGIETGADGEALVRGLQASNFANNLLFSGSPRGFAPAQSGEEAVGFTTYCLVETKAPNGYNLLAQPIGFTIMATEDGDGFVVLSPTTVDLDVVNVPSNLGNALPMTGGAGAVALSGLALLFGGMMVPILRGWCPVVPDDFPSGS